VVTQFLIRLLHLLVAQVVLFMRQHLLAQFHRYQITLLTHLQLLPQMQLAQALHRLHLRQLSHLQNLMHQVA
jgi:hypothetical protein